MKFKHIAWIAASILAANTTVAAAAPPQSVPAQPHGDPGCLPRGSDGVVEPTWEEKRKAGSTVVRRMYGEEFARQAEIPPNQLSVTPDIGTLARDNVMAGLWARCGLTGRERSMVTLAVVMAQRANNQIAEHIRVGMNNGLTQREIEEIIYQIGGYAGMPQAANAREVLLEVVEERRAADK